MAPRAKNRRKQTGLTWAAICRMAADLPAVETAKSGEMPAIRVRKGRLLTWQRDQGIVAIKVDPIDRDVLLKLHPETFFVTDHYRGHPIVLVRLDKTRPELFEDLLVSAWRRYAPKTRGRQGGRKG